MTYYDVMRVFTGQAIMTACLLLLTLQMALLFASFRDRRKIRILYLLHFLLSFAAFYLLVLNFAWEIYRAEGGTAPIFIVLAAFRSLPVYVMILYEGMTGLILLAALWDLIRYRNTHPTAESIKETIDLLPVGIAFGKTDGTVMLSNLTMNDLSRVLTGKRITDLSAFRETITGNKEQDILGSTLVRLPDNSGVWQVSGESMDVDGHPYIQLIATDITEQAEVAKELKEKNEKLRELHMRLDIYNKQADRIIISQELLTARMTVHNEVGNVLLESRRYLKEPRSIDEKLLLQALKNTNTYLLREYEEDDTESDPLADALEMADAIGVDVDLTGMIPTEDPFRMILAAAINECATNTIKHANGDQLSVDVRRTDTCMTYILQSNGIQPKEAIREAGGLLSLRSLVEQENGTMETGITPVYQLKIRLAVENENLRRSDSQQ